MIRTYQRLLNSILILLDASVIALSLITSWFFKFKSGLFPSGENIGFDQYILSLVFVIPTMILTNTFFQLYSSKRTKRLNLELVQIVKSVLVTLFVTMSVLFFIKEVHYSRSVLFGFFVFSVCFLSVERILVRSVLRLMRKKGYNKKFLLIIGAGELGRRFLQLVRENNEFGYEVIGFLDDNEQVQGTRVDDVLVLGGIDDLNTVCNEHLIDQVIVALPINVHFKLGKIIATCEKSGIQTLIIPDYFNYLPARPRFEEVGGIPVIDVRHVPLDEVINAMLKRAFDIVVSLLAIILFLPLMCIIAIGIKISSPGPVFFVQERVGKNRRIFKMYKFRTMKVSQGNVSDTCWTTPNDPRKTGFGSFLRKTSLDELPQFFNVLKGDMSIIGPRPERPFFVEQFKEEIPKYMLKHRVRPGITGWAQVNGWRGDTSIEERIKCDIEYIENWTFMMDIKIALKTLTHGFINKNAY
jgi:Undecaprenyl-phosphate glucose phosphotransferase